MAIVVRAHAKRCQTTPTADEALEPVKPPEPPKRLLVSVEEMASMLSIGRSLAWQLVMANAVKSVHVGRWRRVAVTSIESYVETLMAEAS